VLALELHSPVAIIRENEIVPGAVHLGELENHAPQANKAGPKDKQSRAAALDGLLEADDRFRQR
jgi:hypothetical protein